MKKEIIWVIFIIVGAVAIGGVTLHDGRAPSFSRLLAQVGITVGIASNPYNTLDAQLNQKQQEIDQQQADLAAREATFASTTATAASEVDPPFLWYMLLAIVLLALLISFNFYLDWRRERAARGGIIKE